MKLKIVKVLATSFNMVEILTFFNIIARGSSLACLTSSSRITHIDQCVSVSNGDASENLISMLVWEGTLSMIWNCLLQFAQKCAHLEVLCSILILIQQCNERQIAIDN